MDLSLLYDEGASSRDYIKQEGYCGMMKIFTKLINKLINNCVELLEYQYLAGATVLMIFDSGQV